MSTVTTVALLRKRAGMSGPLFSKYWRDVHGMLATRIPGFSSYVQYHLEAPHPLEGYGNSQPDTSLHGIAVVDFDSEDKRGGLADSEVAGFIREDEINLFQSSLLYNLPNGADALWQSASAEVAEPKYYFLLLRGTSEQSELALRQALQQHPDILQLRRFALENSDTGHWKTLGVDNQLSDDNRFDLMLQITGTSSLPVDVIEQAMQTLSPAPSQALLYPVQAAYAMVADGRPTHLGLRGLDVLQTIEATGAHNQLDARLLACLYGVTP